ncbi:MAG: inovirus Gp2 family protein [Acidiferrobacterales bacterium]|nr:inovirus Gp2 family protein [Acidiferrobacterales bacterium]
MKTVIDGGSVLIDGQEFSIWGDDCERRVFKEIVHCIYAQMSAMLSHHSRILVIRFDLRLREYSLCNWVASEFFRVLNKQLKRCYKIKRVGYVWAREQNTADKQHYHCALILDGNKVSYPDRIFRRIQRIVEARGLPCAYVPNHSYYMIARGHTEAFGEAFYRLSYLAKVATKGGRQKTANDYSSSRVDMKPSATCELELAS